MIYSYTRKEKGFTIVELLIVIVVIAILAAISIVAYNGIQQRAKNNASASTISTYVKALSLYASENSAYPFPAGVGSETIIACFDGGVSCWGGADQARSTTLNTELKKVMSSIPSLPNSALVWNAANGFYIIYRLVDTSVCPDIGGARMGPNDVISNVRQCRMLLPAVS